ncbi:hypothetical protein Syun_009267 [Stephania yunnanensis]|uniref:Uncharacterized protein n=1 Tax=Stephania yunnanensis TaxID=152371 RepID=A0AAP0KE73_9MAGN
MWFGFHAFFHARTKNVEIEAHFARDKLAAGICDLCYVPSLHQTADIFTKVLPSPRLSFLCFKVSLVSSPRFTLRGDVRHNVGVCPLSNHVACRSSDHVHHATGAHHLVTDHG